MDDSVFRLLRLKSQGFCCAQIIIIMALEAQGKVNPDLVRSIGGLCFGIGGSGEACGALSGGACLLSVYSGKGSETEMPDNRRDAMLSDLVAWFRGKADREYGGTRCDRILERFPKNAICGQIVMETYGQCLEILGRHGFDLSIGR